MDARTMAYAIPPSGSGKSADKPLVLLNHLVEPPSQITGITRYALGLMEALVRRRAYRYALVTSAAREDLPVEIVNRLESIITLPHVRSTPLNLLSQTRALPAIIKQTGADVLYSFNPMSATPGAVPTITTVHDLYYDIQPQLYKRRHLLWWQLYFRFAARRAATIACVSENTARDLVQFHPGLAGKTGIVPGAGVLPRHPDIARQPDAGEQPYVLLLGNVTPNKNVRFFVQALQQLANQGRPVRAVHVGRDHSGDLARALQDTDPGLIETRGGLSDEDLEQLMVNAAALVQPSLFEGFGLPIIEAHERGVPVIASDIPVFREVAGHGAQFVALGDVEGFASAIARFAQDIDHQQDMAKKARANALRYSWDSSARAAERIIARELRPTLQEQYQQSEK